MPCFIARQCHCLHYALGKTAHVEVVNNSSPDRIIIQTCKPDMHRTHDPGTINHTEVAPAANRLFVPEPTVKYNVGIQYNRLIHRRCASLDLETAFKEIKISQNIEKEVCKQCQAEFCRCPAFTPGDAVLLSIINAYQY